MEDPKKLLENLLLTVIKEDASDLHLSVGRNPSIRVSGSLIPLVKEPILTPEMTEALTMEMLEPGEREVLKREKELDFSYDFQGKARFRGNAYSQRGFWSVALRLIPTKISTPKELNLPDILLEFAKREQGFFLVVGPIGHGKSTTLASLIDHINHTRAEHILTVEDPIEYIFNQDKSIIDQREVRVDTSDFKRALKSLFREDVNVGMIGEMRDLETISTALTAAETGHLIFSTLHTNNAAQTIDRIIDSFPSDQQNQVRLQLSNALLGVFSQRLVPRVSGGRVPAYELLICNSAIKNLIRENRTHEIDIVIETSFEQGMMSMNRSLADLIRSGEVLPENAVMYSLDPKGLENLM